MLNEFSQKVGPENCSNDEVDVQLQQSSAEERLSLTVGKEDFAQMRIIGQFNLGFIITTRTSPVQAAGANSGRIGDDVFIIDQHASDEKANFERLQAETVVQNQRLVKPKVLNLTAVEEEIVFENLAALEKNGFLIQVDREGYAPAGRRCTLVSLPMSKQVVFSLRDLEELISLLAEAPTTSDSVRAVPRPSKVRKMFAMRACRSSVMIGKTLTHAMMEKLVRKMGEVDKPWNCPHGRPTMRHLAGLENWQAWKEGDGLAGEERKSAFWGDYVSRNGGTSVSETVEEMDVDGEI
jgi:DNA mismatch repair protein PMS2